MAAMNTDPPVIDRLSLLPDDIICNILSFLSTKEAVVTSVLSKRYSYIFASAATIDLDYGLFWSCYKLEFGIAENRFTEFMNKMINSNPRINKFRIGFGAAVDASPIRTSLANSWILEAIKRNVKILDIGCRIPFIDSENSVFLPNELFHCGTLVSLKLVIAREIKVPEHVDMPNLKELDVTFFQNVSPDFITVSLHNLFTGCPLLEDLRLSSCICQDFISGGHVIFISIPSLKNLKLHWYGIMPKTIVDAPNLLHFDSSLQTKIDIKMKILNCHINDRITTSPISSELRGFSLLIDGAFRVKSLSLKVYRRQMGWFFAHCSLPKFPMLKHLELLGATNDYWESLFILDSMPALECLVMDLDYMRRFREHIVLHMPLNTPICFYQSLKEVEFRNFCGHQNDFALAKYILQRGEALTRMTIHLSKERDPIKHGSCSRLLRCGCHSRSIQSVCDELLALTTSSKICEIVFT